MQQKQRDVVSDVAILEFITGKLLGQSMQKKYLCLHLVPLAANHINSPEQVMSIATYIFVLP